VKILVGLGNPGSQYERTRHNAGWLVIDKLAGRHGISLRDKKFRARIGSGNVLGNPVVLACPETYMNLSGDSVGPMAGFYKVPVGDVVIVHDDVDLPFGVVRVKEGGGHGGHNGLRDLVVKLGGPGFVRVRLGVGRPEGQMDTADWVLARWKPAEEKEVPWLLDRAADAVESVLRDGVKEAMNRYNGLPPVMELASHAAASRAASSMAAAPGKSAGRKKE
jgi:PTH1 family peptidyl-tRNA hydrolase